jgi:anti-sigma factor RsiW
MSCKIFETKLLSYLDGEVDSTLRAQIEAHLSSCHKCQEELYLLQRAYSIIDNEKQSIQTNPFLNSKVWEKLKQENEKLQIPIIPLRKFAFTTIAAAGLAIGLVIGSMISRTNYQMANSASETEWEQLADEYFPNETFSPYEQLPTNE